MDGPMTKTIAATGAVAAGLGPLDSVALHLFNVSATTIFMALAGAILSFAYNEGDDLPPLPKKRMYFLIAANTIVSAALVSVAPEMLGWSWYNSKVEGSMALLLAVSARFTIPLLLKTLPEILRKWFKLGEYNQAQRRRGPYYGDEDENI